MRAKQSPPGADHEQPESRRMTAAYANAAAAIGGNNKAVATKHKQYSAMCSKWKRCRDVADGRDAVIAGGEAYLPKLHEQTALQYEAYLKRACFYGATWRTICAMGGMLFRKPELVEVPDAVKPMLENVNMKGEPLHLFAQHVALECFKVGRVGLLVDYPPAADPKTILTVARAQALGLRPSIQRYMAEDIINWRTGPVGNVDTLLMVTLEEQAEVKVNEFATRCEKRYRVLDLVGDPADPDQLVYRVRLFTIDEKTDSQVQIGADQYPSLNGRPLRRIPFVFLSADEGLTTNVPVPPMIDLVDMNLAHFRVSADYEHGCHFTGLPTPYIAGYQASVGEKLYIGSTNAWVFPDPATTCGYIEFSGAGLGQLQLNLERKEQHMAALGARMLAQGTTQVTATTSAIQHSGEVSVLAAVAQTLSLGLSAALRLFTEWAGYPADKVRYEVNRDFFPVPMDAQTLAGLVAAWQAGAISAETLFANLKQGEIVAPEADFEDEQAKIANAPPSSSKIATQ